MYSQYEEERYILESVAGITRGRFLDIGAWHPTIFSNTRALFERGWSGVMVEPSPEPFVNLLKEYGNEERVELLHAAAGFERGLQKIHATADAVSTGDEATFRKWQNAVRYDGVFWSPTITLEDLISRFVSQFDVPFDFVNFDAEGVSVDLFIDFVGPLGQRPACCCVEHDDRLCDANRAAKAAGMRLVHENGTNVVYAR